MTERAPEPDAAERDAPDGPADALDERLRALATRVRRVRRALDISQEELADRAGVSRSVVAELERSRLDQPKRKEDPRKRPPRNITLDTLFRVADALNVEPATLLEDGNTRREP